MNIEVLKSIFAKVEPVTDSSTLAKIDAYLIQKHNMPLPYIPKPSHTPSSLGTKCLRKIYYQYFKVAKDIPTDEKGAKIFDTGLMYEDMIMEWIKAIGEHIPYRNKNGEIPIDRKNGKPNAQFPITIQDWRINKGFIDNIYVEDGKLWIYEIKSSNERKFEEQEGPQEEHKYQISCYFKAVNDHLANGDWAHIPELAGVTKVHGIKVIYINKNNSELEIFSLLEQDLESYKLAAIKKLEKANDYIDRAELPPKTQDKCSYCPWVKKCKKNWNIPLTE